MRQTILPTLALASLAASEYVWPSPYDEIEDHLSLQTGYLRRGFIDGQFFPTVFHFKANNFKAS